ncbi:MAG: hypothetical protein KKH41_07030 [Candidatus Thermoplasmatota archaeon]|nr:hypothetical protein [Euryarchaeota archaeon]MBU4031735.1 hypothetical protein [Candidatus Thermoplasmatota archaeon]MBU4072244.1 hypothetical protein [Candidatus Thermoplasmatota archaeon]MBU4144448.1 hypothetical protein [Candidatus Thermoplasmatota archaeon]MBU4592320.1 hypothetical protein [Candidatus Thermoplasmatota archaeon]
MKKMAIMAITMLTMVAVLSSVVNANSIASVSTDKKEYEQRENVQILITNNCRGALALCDYSIQNENGENVYTPKIVAYSTILQPGEIYTYIWTQTDDNGNMVVPGTYDVIIDYDSVQITILAAEEPNVGLVTDKSDYLVEQNILITMTNNDDKYVIVSNEYWVEDAKGNVIYTPRMVTFFRPLAPGAFIEYTWNQIDDQGKYIAPGAYTVCILQDSVRINIIDTPQIEVVTDKPIYDYGESVQITFTNVGDYTISVCTGYFVLDSNGEIVYTPNMIAFTPPLPPGSSIEYTWDQTVDDGTQVLPGTYIICTQHGSVTIDITAPNQNTNNGGLTNNGHSNSGTDLEIQQIITPKPVGPRIRT